VAFLFIFVDSPLPTNQPTNYTKLQKGSELREGQVGVLWSISYDRVELTTSCRTPQRFNILRYLQQQICLSRGLQLSEELPEVKGIHESLL
jgi:hypothetical protein